VLVRKVGSDINGINRKGLVIALPETIIREAQVIPEEFILDGECIGDVLFVFDVLQVANLDLRKESYQERLVALINLLGLAMQQHVRLADTSFTPGQKRDLLNWLKGERKEGIVLKRLDAFYTPGRPASGGAALKHKFYATVSAVVSKVNPQRSVELRLLNRKGWIPVGNVTIPVNQPVPEVGWVVEIRYLYAFKESNALYQPVFLGRRKDIEQHECILSQLKFNGGGMSEIRVKLINKKHVKAFALEMAKGRAHKFTRVGGDFLLLSEGRLKEFIRSHVRSLPSSRKTIQ
jgi:bifunctional non-homologous end joining protein LigD